MGMKQKIKRSRSAFHSMAKQIKRMGSIVEEDFDDADESGIDSSDDEGELIPKQRARRAKERDDRKALIMEAKKQILETLASTSGDYTDPQVQKYLDQLTVNANPGQFDPRRRKDEPRCAYSSLDGIWVTKSRSTFNDCLGTNQEGDPMYALGRMSFGTCLAPENLFHYRCR